MKHTPEPWSLATTTVGHPVIVKEENGKLFPITVCDFDSSTDGENSKRIIECVNAMAGIEDPKQHRDTWDAIQHLHLDAYHKLKEEHDLFVRQVKHMRDVQKDYFRTRLKPALITSKELERVIDQYVAQQISGENSDKQS